MVNVPESLKRNAVRDGNTESLTHLLRTIQEEPMQNDFAPKRADAASMQEPYLKQDFDGKTLYVSSIMTTPDEVESLIRVLTAFKSLIPTDV